MRIFNLGELNWKHTQLVYHALAHMNIEGLVLHSSKERYICVGLHQDPRNEIDIDYCKKNDIEIFRRETGGGTVLLDNNQLFYNLIINRNNPEVPRVPESFFKKFLKPVVQTCHKFGIKAEFHPICDLVVDGRKISGNGGGEIGGCNVLVGNILLDFNYKLMSRVINSSENLKEKYYNLIKDNMTTVQKELGFIPPKDEIYKVLAANYEELLGPMDNGKLNKEISSKMFELDKKYSLDSWAYQRGVKHVGHELKVREGVFLFNKTFETSKGISEIICETEENIIKETYLSGQIFLSNIHIEKIREKLIGLEYKKMDINGVIDDIIKKYGGVLVA